MKHEDLMEALGIIAEEQGTCASVDVRIGGTTGTQVEHGSLYLLNCPSCVVDALLDQGFTVSVGYGAVRVDMHQEENHA